jgi:glyoxylase-like metal-dependent hydrolase (beta-lactamase superfamily II)/rhodanese-related sulfurtransferase
METGTPEATDAAVDETTADELKARMDRGEDVFVLDVRARETHDEWHLEGEHLEVRNYPYFELLEEIPADLLRELPEDRPITTLCAKGETSEVIAEAVSREGFEVEHLVDGMQGWARVYESDEIDADSSATIVQYRRPSSGCLAYLVVSDGEAVVVDPLRAFTDRYVRDAGDRGAELTYALDTHVHADHVSGIRQLAEGTDATAVLPAAADARGVDYERSYETVEDGETIAVGDVEIEAIHTPGHTSGMTAYAVDDVLFTGDGLFTESVARPDLEDPEAARRAAETLYESLHDRVLSRAPDTVIAPAHFSDAAIPASDGTYTARLGDLEAAMNALSMDREAFVEHVVRDMPPRPANYEDIIATNLGKLAPDDERAFELELGPNNCAASETGMIEE